MTLPRWRTRSTADLSNTLSRSASRGARPHQVTIDSRVVVGRECEGIVVEDGRVSAVHLALDPSPATLTVVDLGSTNGTLVNGALISAPTELRVGDLIRLGDVEIAVVAGPVAAAPPHRLHELEARPIDGAVIRFRAGTPGERAAAGMASSVRKARTRLAGLGPELKAVAPQICLVDPFPDPSTGETVTEGSVVDVGRREIWMAVTAESPAESPERPLALLLGSALPAAADLGVLLEGYGLAVGDAASPDAELANMDLPNLADADGELRTAMILSFVAFLLAQASRDDFLRMLHTRGARPRRRRRAGGVRQRLAALEESGPTRSSGNGRRSRSESSCVSRLAICARICDREIEMFVYMLFGLAFTRRSRSRSGGCSTRRSQTATSQRSSRSSPCLLLLS